MRGKEATGASQIESQRTVAGAAHDRGLIPGDVRQLSVSDKGSSMSNMRASTIRPTFASQSFTPYDSSNVPEPSARIGPSTPAAATGASCAKEMPETNWMLSQSPGCWAASRQNSPEVATTRNGARASSA